MNRQIVGFSQRSTLLGLILVLLSSTVVPDCLAETRVTSEVLGQPFFSRYPDIASSYAKNIWDMIWFEDKLYFGAGNSSNSGPAANAGPIPITYYDPAECAFRQEGKVEDEQIDRFVLLNGQMYIPGHDARQSWDFANYYRYSGQGRWEKIRRIPKGLHMYDLASFGGSLFAAMGTYDGGAVARSADAGLTWKNIYETDRSAYSFIVLQGKLYLASGAKSHKTRDEPFVHEYQDANFVARTDLTLQNMFPDTSLRKGMSIKLLQVHVAGDKTLYIGAYWHGVNKIRPFGLYLADSLDKGNVRIKAVSLPDGFAPWDLVVKGETIYLLANKPDGRGGAEARILSATVSKPERFEQVLTLNVAQGFMRALEEKEGVFYVAVGADVADSKTSADDDIPPSTGQVIKVGVDVAKCTPRQSGNELTGSGRSGASSKTGKPSP